MGLLLYFLGIEVALSKISITLCHRKYLIDLLSETDTLGVPPIDTRWIPRFEKPIYFTVSCRDITYPVGVTSQFMAPRIPYWEIICVFFHI